MSSVKHLTTKSGKVEPRADVDNLRDTTAERSAGNAQPDRRVVITWHLRSSGWPGRLLGGILTLALLVWAALFSVFLALFLAGAIVVAIALLVFAVWKSKHARLRWEKEFAAKAGNGNRERRDG